MSKTCVYTLLAPNETATQLTCFPDYLVVSITVEDRVGSDELLFDKLAIASDMDQLWVHWCGALVFFMQLGFTMLEAGVVKAPNVQHILFKNLMDTCFACVAWYLFGYCAAFGVDGENAFVGTQNVALAEMKDNEWQFWFFQFAFATTAATIVSGAVAERCTMEAYAIYTVFLICWVYPVVVHWTWDTDGWLSAFNHDAAFQGGVIDFAGCGVVHMVGGFSALIGAIFLGPRLGRFDHKSKYTNFLGNNVSLQILGMFILWLGWYGFNCGSTLAAQGVMRLASRIAVNTTFGATAGGLTSALVTVNIEGFWSVPRVVNGVLVGLVSVTSSCAVIEPGLAMITGMLGALIYFFTSRVLVKFQVDDPLDAFSVHGAGGLWGLLSVGLFAVDADIREAGYNDVIANESHGDRFGHQLVAAVSIIAWVCVNAIPMFWLLSYLRILRVPAVLEESGLDWKAFGSHAMEGPGLSEEQSSVRSNVVESEAAQQAEAEEPVGVLPPIPVDRRDSASDASRAPGARAARVPGGGLQRVPSEASITSSVIASTSGGTGQVGIPTFTYPDNM